MDDLKRLLLEAPDSQLDAKMRPYIEKWDEPPTALQVLEVWDYCVHGSLASSFVLIALECLYDTAIAREGITREAVESQATWRDELLKGR